MLHCEVLAPFGGELLVLRWQRNPADLSNREMKPLCFVWALGNQNNQNQKFYRRQSVALAATRYVVLRPAQDADLQLRLLVNQKAPACGAR